MSWPNSRGTLFSISRSTTRLVSFGINLFDTLALKIVLIVTDDPDFTKVINAI